MTVSSDPTHKNKHPKTAALILAGGEGLRMGGNKPFREVGGKTLLPRVIEVAQAQCEYVMISSNEDADVFKAYGLPVVADKPQAGQGPLGGILGGLGALPEDTDWLVTFPVDCPIVPVDMVAQLLNAAQTDNAKAAFASHADRDHYLSSIWHRDVAHVIGEKLADDDRRVRGPLQALNASKVVFDDLVSGLAPFTNINTSDELKTVTAALASFVGVPSRK
ncbi:molybdenum cofactor guanylyltransferase MobA [Paremcibacter congregatus]|uniref:molybdenum cofactor guanylyltransferase MobA n=1 Tax=Paremcibacter congregatus TaxID=2043170 RepID=UPI003A8D851F